jgi:hypothetical protein
MINPTKIKTHISELKLNELSIQGITGTRFVIPTMDELKIRPYDDITGWYGQLPCDVNLIDSSTKGVMLFPVADAAAYIFQNVPTPPIADELL